MGEVCLIGFRGNKCPGIKASLHSAYEVTSTIAGDVICYTMNPARVAVGLRL